jgi:hypothetical protein
MRQYSVPITFWSAYGDSGLDGMSSRLGSVGVSPYSDDDPANTRPFDPGVARGHEHVQRPVDVRAVRT